MPNGKPASSTTAAWMRVNRRRKELVAPTACMVAMSRTDWVRANSSEMATAATARIASSPSGRSVAVVPHGCGS